MSSSTSEKRTVLNWRDLIVVAVISLILGIVFTPIDDGPKTFGAIYLPSFVGIIVVAIVAKRKNKINIFRTAIGLLAALPFLTIAVLSIAYSM